MVCSLTLVGSDRLKPTLQEGKRSLKDKIAAIDIGNSSICLALFAGDELLSTYTTPTQNPEEAAKCLQTLDKENNLSCIAVASVVPEARDAVTAAFDHERVYNVNPKNQSLIKTSTKPWAQIDWPTVLPPEESIPKQHQQPLSLILAQPLLSRLYLPMAHF